MMDMVAEILKSVNGLYREFIEDAANSRLNSESYTNFVQKTIQTVKKCITFVSSIFVHQESLPMPASLIRTSQPLSEAIVATREQLVRQMRRRMRNAADAEDITHDALVAALSNMHTYRGDSQLTTWLYRIGANAALMAARSQQRAVARKARAASLLPAEMNWLQGSFVQAPQQGVDQSSSAKIIGRAVEALPSRYRAVITQHDLEGRPIDKVATRLGLSCAGVRTRRLRALSLLRAWLRLHGYCTEG